MRLIDADKLIITSTRGISTPEDAGFWEGLAHASSAILHAPTVDAVEIVRCKDCVSYGTNTNGGVPRSYMCYSSAPNDFCSDGKRKSCHE